MCVCSAVPFRPVHYPKMPGPMLVIIIVVIVHNGENCDSRLICRKFDFATAVRHFVFAPHIRTPRYVAHSKKGVDNE